MNGFNLWQLGIGALIGSGVTWAVQLHTIRKLKADVVELTGKQLDRKHNARQAFADADRETKDAVVALRRSIHEEPWERDEVDTLREQACSALLTKLIPAYIGFAEVMALEYRGDPQRLERFLERHVIAEITEWARYLSALNHPELLDPLQLLPKTIARRSLDHLRDLAAGTSDQRTYYDRLDQAIDQVEAAGVD